MTQTTRTALITGSGQNIGRSVALALAEDGFDVVINGSSDRTACERVVKEAQKWGVRATIAMGDVGKAKNCRQIAADAFALNGGVDVLVHNAAIRPSAGFLEMDEADWHRVLNVNMNAAFWLSRACLPWMVDRGWGRIVTFAGMNAIHGYNGRAPVSVSKHGSWGLVKSLAKEFGYQGITANIISPGPIRPEDETSEHADHIKAMLSRVPVGRLGEPEEVAAAVSLLVSDKGGFINGQMIQVNGGTET
jgi:3-oxoacyl-[acyl-carrier protein] reductase